MLGMPELLKRRISGLADLRKDVTAETSISSFQCIDIVSVLCVGTNQKLEYIL